MFKANRTLILFLIYVGLAFLSYHLFKPMAFLLASGIVFTLQMYACWADRSSARDELDRLDRGALAFLVHPNPPHPSFT